MALCASILQLVEAGNHPTAKFRNPPVRRATSPKRSIRQIRHEYAVLKRAGVVPKLDARSIKATPTVLRQIRKFQSVLKGESGALRVKNPNLLKELRESGYQVVRAKGQTAHVLVPKAPTEKTRISGGKVVVESPAIKTTRQNIPKSQSLLAWLEENRNRTLKRGEVLAFKFFGAGSYATYENFNLAIDDLLTYQSVEQAIESRRAKDQNEVIQNIEFIEFKGTRANKSAYVQSKEDARRARAKRKREERGSRPVSQNQKQKDKERKARARKEMTSKELEEYKRKARERAAKSRRKK